MDYILGVDIGTGSTKAVAVGTNHMALKSSQYGYHTSTTSKGYSEQNPEHIWEAFKKCIVEISLKMNSSPTVISLSSAMHSVIAVDEQCKVLAPMMTWADSRGAEVAERLLATDLGHQLYEITGTPIHSMSPLCKIMWIKENDPKLFYSAYKFISIKEYIWYQLFHVFQADYSIASCTGLMDIKNLCWSELAMQTAGINTNRLSALVQTTYNRKEIHPDSDLSFLPKGIGFVIGASDGCLANLGTGAIKPGIAALTIGTSGALRVAGQQPVLNKEAMTFSYLLDDDLFINGGPVSNGGIALKWHLKTMLQKVELNVEDYSWELSKIANVKPGAEGLIFLPYLQGERAPIWDSKSCGTFFGLGLNHRHTHLTRAVVEGICFALKDVLLSLEAAGQNIAQLNVSGGFVNSEVWLQILADITGKKLVLVAIEDASAIGAAYLAVKAVTGTYPAPDRKQEQDILPDQANFITYESYFKMYKKLYSSLKGVMHELHDLKNTVQ